jgi:hypothetical protein
MWRESVFKRSCAAKEALKRLNRSLYNWVLLVRPEGFELLSPRIRIRIFFGRYCNLLRACLTGITAYLQNGGTLEHTQQIAAHRSPRTTKLYDRTKNEISLDEVERIKF